MPTAYRQTRRSYGLTQPRPALVCHRDVELSPVVRERCPVLAETYHHVGNVRVRHAATVGGNLAHGDYRLDPPAPLIALHASARIAGPSGPSSSMSPRTATRRPRKPTGAWPSTSKAARIDAGFAL